MNQKKNTKILMILIIIVVILILIGGIAIAFLATDMFKSDKDLFFKYASKIVDSKEGFIENDLLKYFEKLDTTPYNDEGSFSTNMTSDENEDVLKNVNDFNITYSGNVDTANSKSYQEISLNYSDDVNFPINYKQIENKIGFQTKYVGKNYIAVETDKLDKLFGSSISIFMEILEKLQELDKVELTDEEKNHILTTYKEILNEQLSNEKFSKVKESDQNGYKLSLTGEDIKNILVQIIQSIQNDEQTLNIINKYIQIISDNSAKLTAKDVEDLDLIKVLDNNLDINDEKIEITIFSKNGKTSMIRLSTNEFKIDMKKENSQENIKYFIVLEISDNDGIKKMFFNASYAGLSTMQNINESYEIGGEKEKEQVKYQFNKNVNFTDNINIEEFTDQNSVILTDYEYDKVINFLNTVENRIDEVNKQQMEQLNRSEINPYISAMKILFYGVRYEIDVNSNPKWNLPTNELDNAEINTFNEQFEMYASTNQRGVTVKGLLSMISSNNETNNKNRQISEINFNGEEYEATQENITFIKGDIDTEKNYRVEFEKNASTGAIYRVVINEK